MLRSDYTAHARTEYRNGAKYRLEYKTDATSLADEKFAIVNEDDNLAEMPLGANMSQASALNVLMQYKRNNPQDKRSLNVVPVFESESVGGEL